MNHLRGLHLVIYIQRQTVFKSSNLLTVQCSILFYSKNVCLNELTVLLIISQKRSDT